MKIKKINMKKRQFPAQQSVLQVHYAGMEAVSQHGQRDIRNCY